MSNASPYRDLIINSLRNQAVRKILPHITADQLEKLDIWLSSASGQSFKVATEIVKKSDGLVITDKQIKLAENWGIVLYNAAHPFISKPVNIRTSAKQFYVTNGGADTVACAVLDENLNFLGTVGARGATLNAGEYGLPSDFTYDLSSTNYFVVCAANHIVQVYDKQGVYQASIGDGTSGTVADKLSAPVAIGFGEGGVIYILNQSGTVSGATGAGFVAVYKPDRTFDKVALYPTHTGRCFEGEIKDPKDMVVLAKPDKLYILNGNDEIGIFNASDMTLIKVINIPSSIYSSALGLSRLAVSNGVIYVTASTTGEVIAIDEKTGALVGKFGELHNETQTDSPQTLGYFNGLTGITVYLDKIYTTENLNNRIQVFGTVLTREPGFFVEFDPVTLPDDKMLVDITIPAGIQSLGQVSYIDIDHGRAEYAHQTAIARKLRHFGVRIKITPQLFSRKTPAFEVYPVFVLMED